MISVAQSGLVIILSLFLLLHFIILLKIIPYNLIWGGRLKSDIEMYRFEIISIIINLLFIAIVFTQSKLLIINVSNKVITCSLWLMMTLFILNTFGNAISKNKIEKYYFTPVTIILAIFSCILALSN